MCESMIAGGLAALDEPLPASIAQSPSPHCMRLLAVADLHAAASTGRISSTFGSGKFLSVKISHSVPEEEEPGPDRAAGRSFGRPHGMHLDIQAAGIEVCGVA